MPGAPEGPAAHYDFPLLAAELRGPPAVDPRVPLGGTAPTCQYVGAPWGTAPMWALLGEQSPVWVCGCSLGNSPPMWVLLGEQAPMWVCGCSLGYSPPCGYVGAPWGTAPLWALLGEQPPVWVCGCSLGYSPPCGYVGAPWGTVPPCGRSLANSPPCGYVGAPWGTAPIWTSPAWGPSPRPSLT